MALVRLATFNAWKDEGDLPARCRAIGQLAAWARPAVVCLQEVYAPRGSAPPVVDAFTGSGFAPYVAYAPARRKVRRGGVDSTSGHAILSRWPLHDVFGLSLPTDVAGGERMALFARVAGPQPMQMACVHFAHMRTAGAMRQRQFECVLDVLAQRGHPADRRFIAGDFNMTRESANMAGAQTPAGWVWRDLHACRPLATHPLPRRLSFPEGRRIDFLLELARKDSPTPPPKAWGIAGDQPAPVMPSDHALVWADVEAPT